MSTEKTAPGPTGAEEPRAAGDDAKAGDPSSHRIIKRYSNRKLYDTKESRYVTLLQIGELVRAGDEVRIVDNKTKQDLTEVTLAQIIFEEQKAKGRNVPLQTLKGMIQARTEKVLSDLREGPIGRLIPGPPLAGKEKEPEVVEEARESKPRLVEQAKVTLEDWQHRMDDRIRAILPSLKPWHELESEVRDLRARVAELERQLREK